MRRILIESDYAAVWRDLVEGITLYVRERRAAWELLCVTTAELSAGLAQHPDGILCTLQRSQNMLLGQIRRTRIPAVNMFRDVFPDLPSVLSDHQAIGRAAAECFLDRGFTRFAFLGPERDWSLQRAAGFRQRLREAGRELIGDQPPLTIDSYRAVSSRRVQRGLERWLAGLPRPVAIFTAADFVARPLLQACRSAGYTVPDDVAVIGVDNDVAICQLAHVSLSSIPQNLPRIGFEAARLLDGIIAGRRRPPRPVLIPACGLVVRRSTDTFAFQDPVVFRAMRLIYRAGDASRAVPTMRELLREIPLSRQWIDRRFRAEVGHTLSEEIRRAKLHQAESLLAHTHLPVAEISRRCGFPQGENLARFFRARNGLSPQQYRRRHQSPA